MTATSTYWRQRLPELLRHGFTASMFIISGSAGRDTTSGTRDRVWPLMSASQVAELAAGGNGDRLTQRHACPAGRGLDADQT